MRKVAPLSGGFMLASIVGFFVVALQIYPKNKTWGITFMIFFVMTLTVGYISLAETKRLLADIKLPGLNVSR